MYTKQDILNQLAAMNAPRGGVVMMHTSLRAVGEMEGGAQGLLDAMIEYFTADGGLFCVPTHTWSNPGDGKFTLDLTTPSSRLGTFPSVAAADPRGVRSVNPTHSMMVFGDTERALEFVSDECHISSGTDPESCYGKICRDGGYILLVGVSHSRNTYLHCVEEMLNMPNRLSAEPRKVTVRRMSGELVTREVKTHHTDFTNDVSLRFPKYETAFRYHGAITDGFVGNAPAQACDARIMRDTMALILRNCKGKDPLADEFSLSPLLYR